MNLGSGTYQYDDVRCTQAAEHYPGWYYTPSGGTRLSWYYDGRLTPDSYTLSKGAIARCWGLEL